MIKFHGLNCAKRAADDFSFADSAGLEGVSVTFDSLYRLVGAELLRLDWTRRSFETLRRFDGALSTQACANTNCLWCLVEYEDSRVVLYEFSDTELVSETDLSGVTASRQLLLAATDINLYVFDNSDHGFRCLFELNDRSRLSKTRQKQEDQFSESATSSLSIGRVLLDERVAKVVGGKEHLLVLTAEIGQVYSCGLGTKGQLGLGTIENHYEFKRVEIPSSTRIKDIAAGGWHSGCIDDQGTCYLWGWNSHGQLGMPDASRVFVPEPTKLSVHDEHGNQVKFTRLSLGARHSALVDDQRNLYTFGWNKYGQLLHAELPIQTDDDANEDEDVYEPLQVEMFNGRVIEVRAGRWSTLVLLSLSEAVST